MKWPTYSMALLTVLVAAPAQGTELLPPIKILAGAKPIDVQREAHSAPFVGDFDGDGVDDLMVGEFYKGRLRIYKNAGSNEAPKFGDYQWFRAGQALGRVPTSCCIGFTPQLVDLDGDGRKDIVSGTWPGELFFFRRNSDSSFAKEEHLQLKDGVAIDLDPASTVFATDWDADGDLDLLVGGFSGNVNLVPNLSGSRELSYGKPKLLATVKTREASHSHPVAADWDGDGMLDLIVGHSEGGVLWFRNSGSAQMPTLDEARELIPKSPAGWKDDGRRRPDDWGVRAKICVVDWNRDGRLDILLGDYCGSFLSKPDQTPRDVEREQTAARNLVELRRKWAAAFQQYRDLLASESDEPDTDRIERLNALRAEMVRLKNEMSHYQTLRKEFEPQRQAHGYVWLFPRKPRHD